MTWKLIWAFSDLWTESKTDRDEQWLGSWYGHSVTCGLRVKRVTECPYQLPSHCSSLIVLLSVHKSLNAHINFPVIVRLSTFYSQSTSHWIPISTSQSLFVSLRFTLSPQVTECPYQLPSHLSSLYVLLSVNKSLNAHINFQVIVRLSPFYSESTSHGMPISTWQSLFVFLWFTLSTRVTECPYQLPSHFSSWGLRVKRRETNNDWEVDMGIQWLVDWE
jgi:hypothetical protein